MYYGKPFHIKLHSHKQPSHNVWSLPPTFANFQRIHESQIVLMVRQGMANGQVFAVRTLDYGNALKANVEFRRLSV
ncbi:hypothetical protein J1614_004354 [Plenodomus biglobosus]|nr:hypothetical protein J1614_004354 [Plenodomus biglobosus]